MRGTHRIIISILVASFAFVASEHPKDWPFGTSARAQEIDWQKVDDALGRKPAVSGDVHRYGFPRTDLTVTLDSVTIKPAFALGGWIAFKPAHGGAMAMGDLVLLESEVNPVMLKLIEGGLEINAVHNPPSTCTSAATATRPRWRPLSVMHLAQARLHWLPRPQPPLHR
jgi:hypothetical protein